MKTPIAVVIFNRPDHAAQLRERLRAEESRELFLISDGSRKDRMGEQERVDECRRLFHDWRGTIHCNYAPSHMGCKPRVSSGFDWVFAHADRAIILEDDCLPHPQFFRYCDEMLERYADDPKVMSICGTKTFPGWDEQADILFSRYSQSWGWATWRRAWAVYDDRFSNYTPKAMIATLRGILGSYRAAFYWYYLLHQIRGGKLSAWDYCWNTSCFVRGGYHAYPRVNLVINSGFGASATHTRYRASYVPQHYGPTLVFPLCYPSEIDPNDAVDTWIEDHLHSKSIGVRSRWVLQKLRRWLIAQHNDHVRDTLARPEK